MMQKKLPFDKRQYAQRLESIELMRSKLLTKGQLKCVKRFCSFLFAYERSSFEGDLTLIATDANDQHTETILQRCQISMRTLANWIAWAKHLGVVKTAIDCDGYRTRRTTLSIIWSRVTELSTVVQATEQPKDQATEQPEDQATEQAGSLHYGPETVPEMDPKQVDKMQRLHFAQNATVARQNATVARQNATVAFCLIENKLTKSQHSQCAELGRECGSDFEKIETVKGDLKALGVRDRRCVDRALARGVPLAAIEAVARSAREVDPPPEPRVIWGRVGSLAEDPEMAEAPWPPQIDRVRLLRKGDEQHEQAKLRRRAAVDAAGETELTASLVDVLAEGLDELDLDWKPPDARTESADQAQVRWNSLSEQERSALLDQARREIPLMARRPDDSQILIDAAMGLIAP